MDPFLGFSFSHGKAVPAAQNIFRTKCVMFNFMRPVAASYALYSLYYYTILCFNFLIVPRPKIQFDNPKTDYPMKYHFHYIRDQST